ncbi:mucin-4 [Aplysia californica]|uniref:RING-type E3 ubiquitin transferase n=1 Tax=Aplysia californica TaxID=6500 RepID=A0ABM0K001_APLCA|nr:mucin-4 [Aplysia californica]XP_005105531.1 mucin-4 [Aplysia californica]
MPVTRNQSNAAAAQARTGNEAGEGSSSKNEAAGGEGEGSGEGDASRRDSPDNCSICLGPFNNKSFTSSCAHSFCFVCLKQWSKVKAECPLCKQPFTSIFHNIRSNQSYDIYDLPLNPTRQPEYNNFLSYGSFASANPFPFFMPGPSLDADLTLSNFSRFQFRHRRSFHPSSINAEHQYSFQTPLVSPATHVSAATWPRGADDFRREVYRRYLGPPAVVLGTENSNYILTPAMVNASAHRLHRIMPWLTRELRVLVRSHQNVRSAIGIIQPLLTQVMIDSQCFRERVAPYIGHKSQQFIQEFVAFANSAMNVQTYDRKAMYRRRDHTTITFESSSNSSTDDDVVEVTDISPETPSASSTAPPPPPVATRPVPTLSNLLQSSGWDSPTPGPSWESVVTSTQPAGTQEDRVSVSSEGEDAVFVPALHASDSDDSKAGSDIVFVKYDKPWNERSPINLSSDSDGEDGPKVKKKKKSKHKKKRMPSLGSDAEVSKTEKGHKASKSKSKSRDKSVPTSRASGEELEQETSSGVSVSKRRLSASSVDRQKAKKHRKSKDRRDRHSGHDRDRELVDKLFAEAILGGAQPGVSTDADKPSKSSEKSKKKKKHKSRRQEDRSPLHLQTYKKHPSGHKKSTDPKRSGRNPGSHNSGDRGRSRHRSGCAEGDEVSSVSETPLSSSQRGGAYSRDTAVPLNPPQLSSSGFSHSVSSSFQAPYMPMPDTVQHIPLNLWVSTWPSLPVSHTYPPPPPAPQGLCTSPPHNANASSSLAGPSRPAGDSHTISSDSSSDSDDSDDTQDYQDASTESSSSHTQQWIEKNFPCIGASSSQSASATATSSSVATAPTVAQADTCAQSNVAAAQASLNGGQAHNTVLDKSDESLNVDVLSVPSDDEDEDVVICSSASSDNSDNDEDVKVVDVEEGATATVHPNPLSSAATAFVTSFSPQSLAQTSASHPVSMESVYTPQACTSRSASASSRSTSASREVGRFRPFRLYRKNAPTKQPFDRFFPPIGPSSEDESEDFLLRGSSPSSSSAAEQLSSRDSEQKDETVTSGNEPGQILANAVSVSSTVISSVSSPVASTVLSGSPALSSGNFQPSSSSSPQKNASCIEADVDTPRYAQVFTTSESRNTLFSVLPPLQAPNPPPVTSVLSSRLSYLPFSGMQVSSSLSSIMTPALPYRVPQPPPPPPLPIHFPFPPFPPSLPTLSSVLSPLYPALTQTSASTGTTLSTVSKQDHSTIPEAATRTSGDFGEFTATPATIGEETAPASCQPVVSVAEKSSIWNTDGGLFNILAHSESNGNEGAGPGTDALARTRESSRWEDGQDCRPSVASSSRIPVEENEKCVVFDALESTTNGSSPPGSWSVSQMLPSGGDGEADEVDDLNDTGSSVPLMIDEKYEASDLSLNTSSHLSEVNSLGDCQTDGTSKRFAAHEDTADRVLNGNNSCSAPKAVPTDDHIWSSKVPQSVRRAKCSLSSYASHNADQQVENIWDSTSGGTETMANGKEPVELFQSSDALYAPQQLSNEDGRESVGSAAGNHNPTDSYPLHIATDQLGDQHEEHELVDFDRPQSCSEVHNLSLGISDNSLQSLGESSSVLDHSGQTVPQFRDALVSPDVTDEGE